MIRASNLVAIGVYVRSWLPRSGFSSGQEETQRFAEGLPAASLTVVYSYVGSALYVTIYLFFRAGTMFAANKQQTTKLWMWRMEYLHHEQRPLYFGEWF